MAEGVIKLGQKITPHPCNQEMEARNWAAVKQAFEYLDQIIHIEYIDNNIVYNLENITNLNVTNVVVENNLVVENDISVENNVYISSGSLIVNEINAVSITVIDVTATNITVYSFNASYYLNSSGEYLCPPVCGSGSGSGSGSGGGGGGGGGGGEIAECERIPSELFITIHSANCPGLDGRVVALTYETGGWHGTTSVCDGTLVFDLQCEEDEGETLRERLVLNVILTCGGSPMPMSGRPPTLSADVEPFNAEFGPWDMGPDWIDCESCCDSRDVGISFTITE